MDNELAKIAELFGLGAETPLTDFQSDYQSKIGKDAQESGELGRICLGQDDHVGAIQHFKRAIEQADDTDREQYRCDLAAAFEFVGDSHSAFEQLKLVREANPKIPEATIGLAEIYHRHGRQGESIRLLAEAVDRNPKDAKLQLRMAELLRDTGFPRKALQYAQNAVELEPENYFAHFRAAELFGELGQYQDSIASYRAAIELSPGDDFLYLRVAVAFWNSNRRQEAIRSVRLASELDPSKDLYHGLLEAMLSEMDLIEDAEQESARADLMDEYDSDRLSRLLRELKITEE